ncbi:hypothetical protein FOL47_005278 [Perkinsus chesapeaki]|uniref:Uncharacterized protein n=1 Tax=Perkinsus chesapeaki TaxID=330153 RepID=A0A7J6LY74_PERCH|nr:hypothetical protein FOL47_005278 [Perkinsus chesapeaki]
MIASGGAGAVEPPVGKGCLQSLGEESDGVMAADRSPPDCYDSDLRRGLELNQDIQDRMNAEDMVRCTEDNTFIDLEGNKCPVGYIYCLRCVEWFRKISHAQAHWETSDRHKNKNCPEARNSPRKKLESDTDSPNISDTKSVSSGVIVKDEVVEAEVDYTQPDEEQCSLVDLCSSDEESGRVIDVGTGYSGAGGQAVDLKYIEEPRPLKIPLRKRQETTRSRDYRTSASLGGFSRRGASSSSAAAAAVVDFASTPSTYCPSDMGSPRRPLGGAKLSARSEPNLRPFGWWYKEKLGRERSATASTLRPAKPRHPPDPSRIGTHTSTRTASTVVLRPANRCEVVRRDSTGDRGGREECPLPHVPADWDEKDPRFECKDCIIEKRGGDGVWKCTLCEMDLWSIGEIELHERSKRHKKAARNKVWENMEAYIKRRHSEDLKQLGIVETAARTLVCQLCDVPLLDYYTASKHVNSSGHDEYSQHFAWWETANAIMKGDGMMRNDRRLHAVTQYLLKDMPDPRRLIEEEGIIPGEYNGRDGLLLNIQTYGTFECEIRGADVRFIKREVKYEDESPVVSGWRSSLDDDASDWAIVPSGGSIGAIMRAHPIRSRPRSKGPYDRVAGSLPRVPMNFSETDPRFACRECFEDRGDNRFVCILCDMELWGHADCWAHIHTRRHQKAARYQTWENIENFIRERYGESLGKLGVFETPSKTLRCVHCEKSPQSYYDVGHPARKFKYSSRIHEAHFLALRGFGHF